MELTAVIGTFGHRQWMQTARRAIASAEALGLPVIHHHGFDLADARNKALAKVETEWVVHLDADDELEPGFVEAIEAGSADLRAPSVRYVRAGRERAPWMPQVAGHTHTCEAECLRDGNWLVIGTVLRTEIAQMIRWRDWPVYEDWDFFQRCWLAGATVEGIPDAIYRAHVRPDSRNRAPSMEAKNEVHRRIIEANFPTWEGAAA